MARYIEGFRTTPTQSLYLDGRTRTGAGSFLFFDTQAGTDPLSATGTRGLFVDSSDRLSYWNGTSSVRLTGTGGVATTWEDLYAGDATFALTSATWTITQSAAAALLTLNKTNAGAGAVIAITNSGSGNDITGNAGNWSVTAAGLATFATASVISGTLNVGTGAANGTVQSNGNFDLILQTGNATTSDITIVDAANGNIDVTLNGTGRVDINGTTEGNNSLVVAAGDAAITLGSFTGTDNDNAVSFQYTNNTATTIGAAASTGVANLVSTSLTTGCLLNLELTEGTLTSGLYLRAWDVTAGASVFQVAEDGNTTIAGAGGSNMLTITAGDVVLSDGSLTITDADNANSFSVTNNTATSVTVIEIAGSGVFTGTGTSSFMELSPSGLTTGTAFAITAAALTTGNGLVITANAATTGILCQLTSTGTITTTGRMLSVVADTATTCTGLVDISGDALTTGTALLVSSDSNEVMTSGRVASFVHSASGTTVAAKTGSVFSLTSSITESGTSTQDFDLASFIRTSIHNTAGTLTAQGAVLYLENVTTETLATLTDTTNGLEIVMGSVGTGTGVTITHNNATTAQALTVTSSGTTSAGVVSVTANSVTTGTAGLITANGLTTGTGFRVISSGTITTTGELVEFTGNTATTTTGLVRISGTGLTDGMALTITGGGANMTASGQLVDLNMGAATVGNGINLTTTGAYTGAGVFLIEADTATTGVIATISADALTTGTCLSLTNTGGVMTGAGKMLEIVATGATTATALVDMTFAGLTTGVGQRITADGLTTGSILRLVSSLAGQTAGSVSYISCSNGAADVFSVGVEGHLEFRQSTAPTIAVTTQNGITAAAITAGSCDGVLNLTTTGTSTGSTVLTITYNQSWTVAPRAFLVPRNTAAAAPNTGNLAYVSSTTTTTCVITFPASGTFAATPSFDVFSVEMGS